MGEARVISQYPIRYRDEMPLGRGSPDTVWECLS